MLCELKLPKLSVTTFRLSAAHKILEVRQLGKQPRSQPKLRWGGHLLGTKCHLCSASKCSSCRRPSFTMPVPREVLFSLWREYFRSSHVIFFFSLLYICFPPKVAKSGRSEFSPGRDIAESAIILLGTGWQSMIFRLFFFLLAYRFPGQRTG